MIAGMNRSVILMVLTTILLLQGAGVTGIAYGMDLPDNHYGGQAGDDPDSCPCCPDGDSALNGCAGFCSACIVIGAIASPGIFPGRHIEARCVEISVSSRTYPPPNPPPIRSS
jgi:hypothetical protein